MPPCCIIIRRLNDKPIPLPVRLVVKNGTNSDWRFSAGIGLPSLPISRVIGDGCWVLGDGWLVGEFNDNLGCLGLDGVLDEVHQYLSQHALIGF